MKARGPGGEDPDGEESGTRESTRTGNCPCARPGKRPPPPPGRPPTSGISAEARNTNRTMTLSRKRKGRWVPAVPLTAHPQPVLSKSTSPQTCSHQSPAVAVLSVAVWLVVDYIRNSVSPARYIRFLSSPRTGGDTSLGYVADGFAGICDGGARADRRRTCDEPRDLECLRCFRWLPARTDRPGAGCEITSSSWSIGRVAGELPISRPQFLQHALQPGVSGRRSSMCPRGSFRPCAPRSVRGLALGMGVKPLTTAGAPSTAAPPAMKRHTSCISRGRSLPPLRGQFWPP